MTLNNKLKHNEFKNMLPLVLAIILVLIFVLPYFGVSIIPYWQSKQNWQSQTNFNTAQEISDTTNNSASIELSPKVKATSKATTNNQNSDANLSDIEDLLK